MSRNAASTAGPRLRGAGRLFRINLWLHRWASLVATPFFAVLCVTGAILVFHEEIDGALGYIPAVTHEGPKTAKPLAEIVALAQREAPALKPLSVFVAADHPERTYVSMAALDADKLDQGKPHIFNSYTGAALGAVDFSKTPTGFLLELHANWFLGFWGQLFGGFIAVLVLVSLVSGVIVHAPYVKRIAFGVIRRGRGVRLLQVDLHNFIGVIVLGWALAVTLTGVALALGGVALAVWQNSELRAMAAMTPVDPAAPALDARALPTTIDQAVAVAQAARPGRKPYFLVWPGTDYSSPRHYTILMSGTEPYNERLFDVVLVDAASGRLADARAAPWYLKAILISEPLHFGDYGGLPLKLLWTASTLLTLFITGNGAWLWWKRWRRRAAATASIATGAAT